MKIIRYQDSQGRIGLATQLPDEPAREVAGDLFDKLTPTGKEADVHKTLAPLQPTAILCIGLNYRRHAAETGASEPKWPVLFMKNPAAVQNPSDPIVLPRKLKSEQVDYEAELAVIIGRKAKNVSRAQSRDYILGYCCANDVSARDWQKDMGGGQWCRGKSFDTFCPLGPALVTPDDVSWPPALEIRTTLNGQVMQESNTNDMIFDVPTLIEFLSGSMTLLPGTVILTGTPSGVGMARKPPVWLKAGDVVNVEIQHLGSLSCPVIDEAV